MKTFILLIALAGQFTFAAETTVHEKLLAKHEGNWETTVEGQISINGNTVNSLSFVGQRQAKAIFGGKVIRSFFTLKGSNFEGGKTDAQGIGFIFWDKDKKALRVLEFMSDGMASVSLCSVKDENHYQIIKKAEEGVKNKSGFSISKDNREISSFSHNETVDFGAVSEMKWHSKKSDNKNFKVDLPLSNKINEKFIRYKMAADQWVLGGKFLYREGKDENGAYISIIGHMPGQFAQKFIIFEDGSLKAYRPRNAHVWDEVKIKEN